MKRIRGISQGKNREQATRIGNLAYRFLAATSIATLLGACYQGVQPDPTPPVVNILKWERNPDGSQGAQTNITSGGSFSVPVNWLGPNQANIRVYGDSTHGVRKLTVSGSASGSCSTKADSNGQFWTAPSPLSASFPDHVEVSPSGTTRSPMAFDLDGSVLVDNSCGKHSYSGAPPNLEYFLFAPATWTITAKAENGSGLVSTGTFTIKLQ